MPLTISTAVNQDLEHVSASSAWLPQSTFPYTDLQEIAIYSNVNPTILISYQILMGGTR
jgi:hypothetical protein